MGDYFTSDNPTTLIEVWRVSALPLHIKQYIKNKGESMILSSIKRTYRVQALLAYTTFLASLVISYSNVMPIYLIDYKLPMILILLITSLLYTYILVLKNSVEKLEETNSSLTNEILSLKQVPTESISLLNNDYQFDSKIGYYKRKDTGELFCGSCLPKKIPAHLKEFDEYWRCMNCGGWFYKPGHSPQTSSPQVEVRNDKNWAMDWNK